MKQVDAIPWKKILPILVGFFFLWLTMMSIRNSVSNIWLRTAIAGVGGGIIGLLTVLLQLAARKR